MFDIHACDSFSLPMIFSSWVSKFYTTKDATIDAAKDAAFLPIPCPLDSNGFFMDDIPYCFISPGGYFYSDSSLTVPLSADSFFWLDWYYSCYSLPFGFHTVSDSFISSLVDMTFPVSSLPFYGKVCS